MRWYLADAVPSTDHLSFEELVKQLKKRGIQRKNIVFRDVEIKLVPSDEIALRYLTELLDEMNDEPISSVHDVLDDMKWWLITLGLLRENVGGGET